jgi:redox-sensitive bicupin YhaK (pirin superfamily)
VSVASLRAAEASPYRDRPAPTAPPIEMKIRDLKLLAVPAHAATTVSEAGDARLVTLDLEPEEAMTAPDGVAPAWLMPIAGEVELRDERGQRVLAGPASLVELDADDLPEVRGRTRARLLLCGFAKSAATEGDAGETTGSTV